jgi:peptidoglycan/xylan/chitin deacetylase (PgdA/CDA1 family)
LTVRLPRRILRPLRARCAPLELLAVAHGLRLSRRRVGVAIVFHRVEPVATDPGSQLAPALAASVFARQVAMLRAAFQLVPASALAPAIRERRRGERIPLALTFDDDLACHASVSAPLLHRARAPATFFVAGAAMDPQHTWWWWEQLQVAVDGGAASSVLTATAAPAAVAAAWTGRPDGIHAVAEAIKQLDPDVRDELAGRLARTNGSAAAQLDHALSEDGIRTLAGSGFEIGFHTLRHDYLPVLDDGRLAQALSGGRAELEAVVGRPLVAIAYPHGGADPRIADAARAAGYRAGFTTQATAATADDDELLLGRIECSYRSARDLAGRVLDALRWAGTRGGG